MIETRGFYQRFSQYYDELRHDAHERSSQYIDYVISIGVNVSAGQHVLDLGCGTGALLDLLSRKGCSVTGVDLSVEMISVARDRYPDINFMLSDVRSLQLDGEYDLITCFGDTFNHLLCEKDWIQVFGRVRQMLGRGGLFCFDALTPYDHYQLWPSTLEVIDRPGYTLIVRGEVLNDGTALQIHTWFVQCGSAWKRFNESLRQRSFSKARIESWLVSCGFHNVIVLDGDSLGHANSKSARWLFLAYSD